MTEEVDIAHLKALALDDKSINEISKNAKLSASLKDIVSQLKLESVEKRLGNLIYSLLTKSSWASSRSVLYVAKCIAEDKVKSATQLDEALKFLKVNSHFDPSAKTEVEKFEMACGVGVCYTQKQMEDYVEEFIKQNLSMIREKPNHPGVMSKIKEGLKFADMKALLDIYKTKHVEFLETATESKEARKEKSKEEEEQEEELIKKYRTDKLLARDLSSCLNPPEVLKEHLARTKGAVVTRFPPEPNGYLHIGHCKAIRFNFKIASDYGGYTYLRYDDTNPDKESHEYIDAIKNDVLWLGYKPTYITYASDNFDKIYDVAISLIKLGKAYVCKLTKEEAKDLRESKKPSPYRDTSPEENLKEFEMMKNGQYKKGEAVLRSKINYEDVNPILRDPVLYRIKFVSHPHVGDKWCIYPLYDFVHSLCDSFEDITHSLCTLEFENRRDLYYWSLNELNLYRPYVWEYSRLNITFNVLSKRKLVRMIEEGLVDGWDDPRLLTISGIRRRGYPAESLNNFCDLISVTRRGNDNCIQFNVLEHCVRQYLNKSCKHAFCVIEPVALHLTNVSENTLIESTNLEHALSYGALNYVDLSDVKEVDEEGFFGIAPNKIVRLRYGPFVKIDSVAKDEAGKLKVTGHVIKAEDIENYKSVKGILHFINDSDSIDCETRIYERTFTVEFPGDNGKDFLSEFNPNSRQIKKSKIPKLFADKLAVEERYQFERQGYFIVDKDSTIPERKIVFNKIVSLKETEKVKMLATK